MRGRHKGKAIKPNRYWSKEEKLRIVKRVITQEDSINQISKEEKINPGQLFSWIQKYNNDGEAGFERIHKRGIPMKTNGMNHEEELELENMKLRVEIERLKKGYTVRGDGQNKEYISINKKSLK